MVTVQKVFVIAGLAVSFLVACGGSDPTPNPTVTVYQAGYSYDPANNTDFPVPVLWNGVDKPVKLPFINYPMDCAPSGSVQGMAMVNGELVMVGISSWCFGGNQNMKPAAWSGGAVFQLGFWDNTHIIGLAKAIAVRNGSTFIVGAEGTTDPLPTLWWDGYPIAIPVPDGWEAGEAESIVISGDIAYIGAVLAKGTVGHLEWLAGYWTWDLTAAEGNLEWHTFQYPTGADGVLLGVPVAVAGSQIWQAFTPYAGVPTSAKPALLLAGGTPAPLIDFDFASEPYGAVHALAATDKSTLAVGYQTITAQYGLPGPVYWQNTAMTKLSTADPTLGLGEATSMQLVGEHLFIGGQTFKKDPADPTTLVSVPAYWVDGVRHDRQGLTTTGHRSAATVQFGQWPRWPKSSVAGASIAGGSYTENIAQSAVVRTTLVVVK